MKSIRVVGDGGTSSDGAIVGGKARMDRIVNKKLDGESDGEGRREMNEVGGSDGERRTRYQPVIGRWIVQRGCRAESCTRC